MGSCELVAGDWRGLRAILDLGVDGGHDPGEGIARAGARRFRRRRGLPLVERHRLREFSGRGGVFRSY